MIKVTIEADLPAELETQIQRTGFSVDRSGTKLRLRVGNKLVATRDASINIVDISEEDQDAAECKTSTRRSSKA